MSFIADLQVAYSELMQRADPRVNGWFMMSSPWPCLLTILVYYIFIKMGPSIMSGRKPMELRGALILYNTSMVLMSGYCGMQLLLKYWLNGYSLGCQPIDYSSSPNAVWIARMCWLFYITKLLELLDTVFFVLRKKFSQVTFLHMSHHCLLPFATWCGTKFVGGGFSTFFPMLNSFVHTIMYTYYGMSALGPRFQKYLWWKKYMTRIQIIQFIMLVIHSSQLFFIECNYPKFFAWWIGTGAIFYGIMFVQFYIYSYSNARQKHPKIYVLEEHKNRVNENINLNGYCSISARNKEKSS